MKRKLKITGILILLILGSVIVFGFNPSLLYARNTTYNNYNILHNKPVDDHLKSELDQAVQLIKMAEFYDPNFKFDICLNEGSLYSKRNNDQVSLCENMKRLFEAENKDTDDTAGVYFADSTWVSRQYYRYWELIQYCMDIKKMTYEEVLNDTTQEENVRQQMMSWYKFSNN
jgi:hypothetical protein